MKFIITILTLVFSINLSAQEIPKEYRKSNTMVIQMDFSSEEILNLVARSLVEFDYEIDKLDSQFLTISTKPILAKNILNYYIKAKVIELKVEFQIYSSLDLTINGISSEGYSLSNFKGQKGSPNYEVSNKLFLVVSSLNPEIRFMEK